MNTTMEQRTIYDDCIDLECESAISILKDALDIEVKTNISGNYRGAVILITCGGPTVWIDTQEQTYNSTAYTRWSDEESVPISPWLCDQLSTFK